MSKEQSATHDEKACADWYHDNYQRLQVEANKSGKPMALYIAQEAWKTAQSETRDRAPGELEAIAEWIECEEFYTLMQTYRHAPVVDQAATLEAYRAVRTYIAKEILEDRHDLREAISAPSATLESVPSPVKMALKILLNHIEPGWENSAAFVKAWLEDQNAFAE